ncbi:MAG: Gfo/Idh/MocA family oxidoreductase [Planctomycetes bacterium]|nr:Gfo/Idh/MocA family oxidoreductase [Planctomycetota bacterium]
MAGDKTFGVGIVGLGMGHACCPWVIESPGCRLVAVCDNNAERLKRSTDQFKVAGYTNYDELLASKDIDFVYIMTPSGMHADMGIKAAQKGKHVCVAKPMDVTLEKCDALIEACRKANVLCAVDFNGRFADLQQKIRYALDVGLFGKLILGEARLKWYRSDQYYSAGGWRGTWKMDGGGSLANQTIHQIDQLQWFMGAVDCVSAAEVGIFAHSGIETEDLGMALLRFKNGAVGSILGTTTFPKDYYAGLEIHGTEGAVNAMRGAPEWLFHDKTREEKLQRASAFKTSVENMAAVLNGKTDKLICDGLEGRKSIEVLTAVYRSARERKEIKLPL